MTEATADIDKITAAPAPVQKIWPSRSNLVKCIVLVVFGLGLGISSALAAEWILAGIASVLVVYGACSIGWVEIEGDRLTHRRLVRGGTARAIEIREIGLGVQRVKTTKWWFPVIDTHSGDSIDLGSLKSVSRKRAQARVERIHALLETASASPAGGPVFAEKSNEQPDSIESAEPEADPASDFDLTPGYTAYLREKALEEAAAAAAAPPAPAAPQAPAVEVAPVAVAADSPAPQPVAQEPAPQVFEPQPAPQVFEPQPPPQVFEPQPAPQVFEPQPAPQVFEPQPAQPQPALAVFAPQATTQPASHQQQLADQQAQQQAYAQQQAQLAHQQAQQQAYAQQQAQLAHQQAQQQAYAQQQAQLAHQQAQQQAYAQQQAQLAHQQAQQQAYAQQQAQLAHQQAQQQAYAQQQAA